MSTDVIVDAVRRVRDKLVKRYGGLDGWIEHLQTLDRERTSKTRRPKPYKNVSHEKSRRLPSASKQARRATKDH